MFTNAVGQETVWNTERRSGVSFGKIWMAGLARGWGLELSGCFLTQTCVTWAGWLEARAPRDSWVVCPHVASPLAWASHCMGLASGDHIEAAWLLTPCSRRHRVPSTILLDRSYLKLPWLEGKGHSLSPLMGQKSKKLGPFFFCPQGPEHQGIVIEEMSLLRVSMIRDFRN